jgi:starch synthase
VPSATVAFPAVAGQLGIGQGGTKIATSLYQRGWDTTTISVRSSTARSWPWKQQLVGLDRVLAVALYTPLRFREAWLLNTHYAAFDALSSRALRTTDIFYGYSQACLLSLRKARKLGAATVLHAATSHVAAMRDAVDRERRSLGLRPTTMTGLLVRRAEAEYKEADSIRVQSTLVAQSLTMRGVPNEKIVIVPPAVDLEAFRPAQIEPQTFTVGFVGAFSVRKGFHILADAWSRFADGRSRLILHGGASEGWGKAILEGLAKRQDVEVRKGSPHNTYRDSSVVVVPSVEDGFCYVVLEALASGVPVLVSDQVGAKDVIADGVGGSIFPSGNVDQLARQLVTLRDAHSLAPLRSAARARAERYSFEVEGRALVTLFDDVLRMRRSSPRRND